MRTGTMCCRETTKGVEGFFQCKYDSIKWVTLKDMKNSYSVYMAKNAVRQHITGDPAFAWWIRDFLVKRNRIIGKLRSKYWVRTHKFGVKIPKSVQEANAFDE